MSKGKGFIKEFKDFALKGNAFDLAIGVIIGAAFQGLINAVVNDLINPIISVLFKVDFTNMFIPLCDTKDAAYQALGEHPTLAAVREAGFSAWAYGDFITTVINFILLALVVFLIVKLVSKAKTIGQKPAEEAAPTTKVCPFCKEEVSIEATRCPHCTSELVEK